MPSSTVKQMMTAMATQIQNTLCGTVNPLIEELNVEDSMWINPSTPAIDIYPAEDFATYIGYGADNVEYNFVVRARVHTADSEGGQELLLSMMDRRSSTSVALAILSSPTLGGAVENVDIIEETGFGLFPYPADPESGQLIGATWTVRVTP